MEALYFSLSTMTTIGYGVSDYYFSGCWTPLLLVLWQVCTAISFDAVAVGLIFHRISRGRKRGKTITFSDKAVIRKIRGVPHLMFRLGELRRYHLIEASIRVYCIRHERHPVRRSSQVAGGARNVETTHFITRQVKLLHPDESYGNHILMSVPQVVVHRMDEFSPLVPPRPVWYDAHGVAHADPSAGGTEGNITLDPSSKSNRQDQTLAAEIDDLEHFLMDRQAEIVVLVEGTDEGTGAATQARHSYAPSDLAWNHTFAPCVFPYRREPSMIDLVRERTSTGRDPICSIDFSSFHDIMLAPLDCDECPYVPQWEGEGSRRNLTSV
jgi:hypothetical protein